MLVRDCGPSDDAKVCRQTSCQRLAAEVGSELSLMTPEMIDVCDIL
jgi:hypothetical protein